MKTKMCSRAPKGSCFVGKITQPIDQFWSKHLKCEVRTCQTCRTHIANLKNTGRQSKATHSHIIKAANKQLREGEPPIFYQNSEGEYRRWLAEKVVLIKSHGGWD